MSSSPIARRDALKAIALPIAAAAFSTRAWPQSAPSGDVDATRYPVFTEEPAITGAVPCVGSSAVGLLLKVMGDELAKEQPRLELALNAAGSGTAAAALAAGESLLAPMSRTMRPAEIEEVQKRRKGTVDFVDIALDAIAVGVHKANPMTRISLRDLDRIFGRERRRGGAPVLNWSDLGVGGTIGGKRIALHGMGPNSGSNGLVQDIVLQGGPFRTAVVEEPVSSSVVQAIATDEAGIGYYSEAFDSVRVRELAIEAIDGSGYHLPQEAAIRSGRYPLSRAMRIYFVREAIAASAPARKVLEFALSEDGQEIVRRLHMIQIGPDAARAAFARVRAPAK
jgi:phosphate transport system substrate-binding protein